MSTTIMHPPRSRMSPLRFLLIIIVLLVAITVVTESATATASTTTVGLGSAARPEPPPERPQLPPLPPRGRTRRTAEAVEGAAAARRKMPGRPGVMSNDAQAEAAIRGGGGGGGSAADEKEKRRRKDDGLGGLPTFDSNRGGGPAEKPKGPPPTKAVAADDLNGDVQADSSDGSGGSGAEAEAEAGATGPAVFTEGVDVSIDPIRIDVSPATSEQYARLLLTQKEGGGGGIKEYVEDVTSSALRRSYDNGGKRVDAGGEGDQNGGHGRVEFRGIEVDVGDVRFINSVDEDAGRIAILISKGVASFLHSYPLLRGRRLRGRGEPPQKRPPDLHLADRKTTETRRRAQEVSSSAVVMRPPSGEELTELIVAALNDAGDGDGDGGGLLFGGGGGRIREFPVLGRSVTIRASPIDKIGEEDVSGGVVDMATAAAEVAGDGAKADSTASEIGPDDGEAKADADGDVGDTAETPPIRYEVGEGGEEAQRVVPPVIDSAPAAEEESISGESAAATTTTIMSSPSEGVEIDASEGEAAAPKAPSSYVAQDRLQQQQQRQEVAGATTTQGGGGKRSGISPLFIAAAVLGAVFICSATTFFVWSSRHPESHPLATRDLEGKKRRELLFDNDNKYNSSSGALTDGASSSNEEVDGAGAMSSSEASSFPSLAGNEATSSSVDTVCDSSPSKRAMMGGVVGDSLRRVVAGVGTIRPARAPLSNQELFVDDDDDDNDDRAGVGGGSGRGGWGEKRAFSSRGISRGGSGRIFVPGGGRKDGYEGYRDDDDDHDQSRNHPHEMVDVCAGAAADDHDDEKDLDGQREEDRTKLRTAAVVPQESHDDGGDNGAAAFPASQDIDGDRDHRGHDNPKDDDAVRGAQVGQRGGATAASPVKHSPCDDDGVGNPKEIKRREEVMPSPLPTPSPHTPRTDFTPREPCDTGGDASDDLEKKSPAFRMDPDDDDDASDDSIAPPASPPGGGTTDAAPTGRSIVEDGDGRDEDRPSLVDRGMKERPSPPTRRPSSSGHHRHVRSNSFRRLLAAGTLPPSSLSRGIGGVMGGGGGVDRARLIGPNAARSDRDFPPPSSSSGSASLAKNGGDGASDDASSPLVRPEERSLVSYRMDLVECGDVDDGGDHGGEIGDGGGGPTTSSSKADSVVL